MPQPTFAAAALPLFADGLVDAVEWSFDMGWGRRGVPGWLNALLNDYADAGRLDGHGVSFSLLSEHPRQAQWLDRLKDELTVRPYRRLSEHLGFMAAGAVSRTSPLPMPRHPKVARFGVEQVERLADAGRRPVGLENLATALSASDAQEQGGLLEDIVVPADGWLVLDLHNLWCQAANLQLDVEALLSTYRLDLVREVHVSGGSDWSSNSGRQLRRDTHDGPLPPEVTALLPLVLERCTDLETVVVERIGTAFGDPQDDERFRADFRTVRALCGRPT